MVVHYPRTVWKNSHAEHKVTGKTYNKNKIVVHTRSPLACFSAGGAGSADEWSDSEEPGKKRMFIL